MPLSNLKHIIGRRRQKNFLSVIVLHGVEISQAKNS